MRDVREEGDYGVRQPTAKQLSQLSTSIASRDLCAYPPPRADTTRRTRRRRKNSWLQVSHAATVLERDSIKELTWPRKRLGTIKDNWTPGMGKTAILYRRIVAVEVPERVLSIVLSDIMAASGMCGLLEEKFKALIRDIEDDAAPGDTGGVICFINDVHKWFH
ncbi:hypothetical protein V8E53_010414 [Lactarius tabidus]